MKQAQKRRPVAPVHNNLYRFLMRRAKERGTTHGQEVVACARHAQVTREFIYAVESGRSNASDETRALICDYLGVNNCLEVFPLPIVCNDITRAKEG